MNLKPSGAEQTWDRTRRASDMTVRRRTATSSAGGSSSPGPPGRWSLRCSSAGTDPPSCCKLPQTPAGGAVLSFDRQGSVRSLQFLHTAALTFPVSCFLIVRVMNEYSLQSVVTVPHCHQTRSTVGWQRGRQCAHKRRCCCRRPRTHSLGNTPVGKRDSHVPLKVFLS